MCEETQQETIDEGASAELRRPPHPGGKLKPERVQSMLETMPGWRLAPGGNALATTRKFTQAEDAARFAAAVAGLSAAGSQTIILGVNARRVTLRLQRKRRNGIDLPLLDLARQIV